MVESFMSLLTGSFSTPAAGNPTVAMVEAAYRHHGLDARYINCDVLPGALGDAVRGAHAMGWAGFNCSTPHKVAVLAAVDANLQSITAVVIGGTSLFGGRGGVIGTLFGAVIVVVFTSGLTLANNNDLYQPIAEGILVIIAVAVDQWIRRVRA